ncbi:MAG: hypothetical protein ACQGVC_18195 [Myxococcota bacterium]
MATGIRIHLDARGFRRDLARVSDIVADRVAVKALNRTAFEVLDAEKAEAARALDFHSPATRRHLAGRGSFRFDKAIPGSLRVRIMPRQDVRGSAERILGKHQRGGTYTAATDPQLRIGGLIAVPITAKSRPAGGTRLTTRGRVRARDLPGRLLAPGGKGFVSGNAILARRGRGRSRETVAMYALVQSISIRPEFRFFDTARRTAVKEFPRKMREEFGKARLRGR